MPPLPSSPSAGPHDAPAYNIGATRTPSFPSHATTRVAYALAVFQMTKLDTVDDAVQLRISNYKLVRMLRRSGNSMAKPALDRVKQAYKFLQPLAAIKLQQAGKKQADFLGMLLNKKKSPDFALVNRLVNKMRFMIEWMICDIDDAGPKKPFHSKKYMRKKRVWVMLQKRLYTRRAKATQRQLQLQSSPCYPEQPDAISAVMYLTLAAYDDVLHYYWMKRKAASPGTRTSWFDGEIISLTHYLCRPALRRRLYRSQSSARSLVEIF